MTGPSASAAALTADSGLTFPSVRVVRRTLESGGKAGTNVAMAPSVSYSITVRLEVASRGRAVSAITRAVEQAGGVVTALADVVSPDEIGPHYIIPSVFHPDVTSSVAAAVADAATQNAATQNSGR
jgi:hypothetical protein